MKNLIILITSFTLLGCGSLNTMHKKKEQQNLVALPFGYHELLMDQKDSAFVNDCLMSDPTYYLAQINKYANPKYTKNTKRKIVKTPNLSQIMIFNDRSETTFVICVDNKGIPRFSKFLSTTSTNEKLVREMHHITLQYRYNTVEQPQCIECGKFTFKTDINR